jgi:hypothetical protein
MNKGCSKLLDLTEILFQQRISTHIQIQTSFKHRSKVGNVIKTFYFQWMDLRNHSKWSIGSYHREQVWNKLENSKIWIN